MNYDPRITTDLTLSYALTNQLQLSWAAPTCST